MNEYNERTPSGFIWKECQGVNAWIQMPETWFYHNMKVQDTQAFFMTKENLKNDGIFTTGLMMNVVPQITEKTGISADAFARRTVTNPASPAVPIGEMEAFNDGPLHIYRRHVVVPVPSIATIPSLKGGFVEKIAPPTHFYYQTVANHNTDRAYILVFECPSVDWKELKSTAQTMIENSFFDQVY